MKPIPKTVVSGAKLALATSLAFTLAAPHARAGNIWDGGGATGNWSDLTNWDSNTTPVSPTGLQFAGLLQLNSNNDLFAAGTVFNSIAFNAGAGAFTLTGNGITLGGTVTNTSSNLQTINLDLILTGNRTFTNAGTGNTQVGGVISGVGFGILKTGAGTLTLNGANANTYTGATAANGGVLQLDFANMATATDLLNATSTLTTGGGEFNVKGKSTGVTSQTLGNVTQTGNSYNRIVVNANGGAGTTLALGTLGHNSGGSTLIDISSVGAGVTTASTVTNGLLNASYLVKDATGTGFATKSGSNVIRYDDTTGTTLSGAATTAGVNYTTLNSVYTSGSLTLAAGNQSLNSLAIDTTNNGGTIDLVSGVKTLTSTGLLFRGANSATVINGQLGASGSEVNIHQLGSGTLTINSTLGGGGTKVTKDGSGELVINSNNTFTGGLMVNDGTVTLSGTLGSGPVQVGGLVGAITNTTTLNLNVANAITGNTLTINNANAVVNANVANSIGSGASLALTAGTLNINGAQTRTGNVTVNSGFTLGIGDNGALGTANLILGGGTIRSNNSAHTISNTFEQGNANTTIAGSQDLTFNGLFTNKGSATLTVTNSGLTTFGGGIMLRESGGAQRSLTLNGTGNIVISGSITNGTSFNGIMDYKSTGTTTVSGNNSYSGATTIGGGNVATTVKIGSSTALGFGGTSQVLGSTTVNTGATLDLNGQTGIVENIAINGTGVGNVGALINSNASTTAVIDTGVAAMSAGAAGLSGSGYTDGTHALTITGGGGTGATAFATVVSGTVTAVQVTSAGTGYTSAPTITLDGAGTPVTPATFNVSLSSLGLGSASSVGGAGNITVNTAVTGGFAFTKVGAGKVTLNGANALGATTVSEGTLLINGTSGGAVNVTGGVFGGTGTITNTVSIGNSGTLAAGNSPGTLNTGALSLTGTASTIAMEIAGAGVGQYDQINVTGAVNLNGNGKIEMSLLSYTPGASDIYFLVVNDGVDAINGTLYGLNQGDTFNSGGYTWQVSYVGNSVTNSFTGGNDLALVAVIPEPGTIGLLGLASAFLLGARRRRRE
jgi:fibronectin-binding autotransporter adhesin